MALFFTLTPTDAYHSTRTALGHIDTYRRIVTTNPGCAVVMRSDDDDPGAQAEIDRESEKTKVGP